MDIFEEPENQRVLADDEIYKKMFFSQSRLLMAMQGCYLVLRFEAQKSRNIFEEPKKSPKFWYPLISGGLIF